MSDDHVSDDRSAALLLRVWLEDGAGTFRARLMAVGPDGDEAPLTVATAASPGDALTAVREWLDRFVAGDPDVIDERG